MNSYQLAKEKYSSFGIDCDEAIARVLDIPVSVHCWQGDDVTGFETASGGASGGIQTTGDYPGKARTPDELAADLDMAFGLLPGKLRLNLHASYAVSDHPVERNKLTPKEFEYWMQYAEKRGLGLDFNPTVFGHPMAKDSLTLSSPNDEVRRYWIDHAIACRRIAAEFAKRTGSESLCNLWITDGYKDIPADRLGPRLRLKDSLDEIFAESLPGVVDSVESKLFGIGLEAYTVGSQEFYMSYAASHKGVYPLLDSGHYHPTETISDKIPSLLCFYDKLPLHVTRAIRWDSDHVVLLDDELKAIANEIIRNNAESKVLIGLDYFDASINRVAAWVVGVRAMKKALLCALLTPWTEMKSLQDAGSFTKLMVLGEAVKTAPIGAVWDELCRKSGVPDDSQWLPKVEQYEKEVLSKRV